MDKYCKDFDEIWYSINYYPSLHIIMYIANSLAPENILGKFKNQV